MAKRKTVNVEELKTEINDRISWCSEIEGKRALCFLLERVLHDTGNYKGFKFNVPTELASSNDFDVVHPQYYDRTYY